MKKPDKVDDPSLQIIVDDCWTSAPDPIGDGSIADAIQHERETGQPTYGVFHSTKGKHMISRIERWQRKGKHTKNDKRIARAIRNDIRKALSS